MNLNNLYGHSLSLLTDLYQLTMAYGYWKSGLAEREAVFHLFFRKNPFKGGYAICAGLERVTQFLEGFQFSPDDLDYLAGLKGNDGKPLFESGFLHYLQEMRWACDLDGMPEGTAAFPHEPLLRVKGPLIQAQLVETPLLNMINFETLIATKSSRICAAAQGEPVLEFGLRRAQGVDGGLAASRAAYIGGCVATSNVLAGKLFDIPVKGTHAHSWVMVYEDEVEAFEAYAAAMPNNCVFLVDTYDTVEGVKRAVEVGTRLRARGHELMGVRLDSGDLAALSIEARRILDEGGFPDAAVVASNDLHEGTIANLKARGARIGVWGVGTKLATAYDQPALGGVYKLAAIRDEAGAWQYRIKLSEMAIKVSTPGIQQVVRYAQSGVYVGDVIWNEGVPGARRSARNPADGTPWTASEEASEQMLLQPVFRGGKRVRPDESIHDIRSRALAELGKLSAGIRRQSGADDYPVGLEPGLYALKAELMARAGSQEEDTP
jgi:nicotinate phosphoribosyltransferase